MSVGWHISLGAGGVCVSRTRGHGMAGATSSLRSSSWLGLLRGGQRTTKPAGKGEAAGPRACEPCLRALCVYWGLAGVWVRPKDDGEETEP